MLMTRSAPIWKAFERGNHWSFSAINTAKMHLLSGVGKIDLVDGLVLMGFLILAIIVGSLFIIFCNKWLRKDRAPDKFIFSLIQTARRYAIPLLVFGTASLYFLAIYSAIKVDPFLELISYSLFFATLLIALFSLFVAPPAPAISFLRVKTCMHRAFMLRFVVFVVLALIGYLAVILFRDQKLPTNPVEIIRTVYMTLLSLSVISLLWLFVRLIVSRGICYVAKSLLIVLLITTLFLEWVGYHHLALYIVSDLFASFLLGVLLWIAMRVVARMVDIINNNQSQVSRKIKYYLGVKPHKNIYEFSILKLAFYIFFLCVFLFLLLKAWGVSRTTLQHFEKFVFEGFDWARLKISVSRIIVGLAIFSVISMVGRLIAAHVTRKHQFQDEKDTQVAVASIINYIVFAIALIVGLLVAGVDFTGLAIIAGALSVGIGLGLQGIVNNFVSGIILLLEKPIKVGDRIAVEGTEGFVRKIRIRATQINTLQREDVIVPNSELVTKQVVNYMFRDPYWRLSCKVGVAYGSDVELVKKLLTEVALNHSDVVQDSPHEPIILFKSFGDSSLNFELWVVIKDVNKKFIIESELNFAINQAFKQNAITIAFPQRDVHIKNMPTT